MNQLLSDIYFDEEPLNVWLNCSFNLNRLNRCRSTQHVEKLTAFGLSTQGLDIIVLNIRAT